MIIYVLSLILIVGGVLCILSIKGWLVGLLSIATACMGLAAQHYGAESIRLRNKTHCILAHAMTYETTCQRYGSNHITPFDLRKALLRN